MSAPPEWPSDVPPPAAPEWERRAVGWLFDLCPPDARSYAVLRRHPLVLARVAREQVAAALEGCRRGLATARADLGALVGRGLLPPEVVEAAVAYYEREGARLAAVLRGVGAVEAALRGERYVPRL